MTYCCGKFPASECPLNPVTSILFLKEQFVRCWVLLLKYKSGWKFASHHHGCIWTECSLTILLYVQYSNIGQPNFQQHRLKSDQMWYRPHWAVVNSNKPHQIEVHSCLQLWQYHAVLCKYIDLIWMALSPAVPEPDEWELVYLIM